MQIAQHGHNAPSQRDLYLFTFNISLSWLLADIGTHYKTHLRSYQENGRPKKQSLSAFPAQNLVQVSLLKAAKYRPKIYTRAAP